jgi:CheY-like chemotaxis protein
MQEKHGLAVRVEASDEPEDDDIRVFLFQCVRELLFNVVKHAEAPDAHVLMHRLDDDQISVTVRDSGKGVDLSALSQSKESFGLLSIRERLGWLGGRFELDSAPGAGTEARLIVPVRKALAERAKTPIQEFIEEMSHQPWKTEEEEAGSHIRVLIVDDHAIVRQGLTSLLESEPDLKIVGQVSDGQAAVDAVQSLPVDVVVMDFSMPGMNGAEATRRILELKPYLPIIGMSVYEEQSIAETMRKAGAGAFFRKDGPSEELIATIRSLTGHSAQRQTETGVPA